MTSNGDEQLARAIVEYHQLKGEISAIKRRQESLKQLIGNEMNRRGKDRLRSGKTVVTRRLVETRRISRQDLPEEIYERYAVPSQYYTYTVKKEEKQR